MKNLNSHSILTFIFITFLYGCSYKSNKPIGQPTPYQDKEIQTQLEKKKEILAQLEKKKELRAQLLEKKKEILTQLEKKVASNPTCNANIPNPSPLPNETAEFYGDCSGGKPSSGIVMRKQSGKASSLYCLKNGNHLNGYDFDKCSKYFTMIPNYCKSGDYNGQCLNGVPHGVGVKLWRAHSYDSIASPDDYMALNGQFVNGKPHGYVRYSDIKRCGALGCTGGTNEYDAWFQYGEEQYRCLGEGGPDACSDKTKQAKLSKDESVRRERQEMEQELARKNACGKYYPGKVGMYNHGGWLGTNDDYVVRYVNKDQGTVTIEGTERENTNSIQYGEMKEISCDRL